MSIYQSARLDDYRQRMAKGETLTVKEQRDCDALSAQQQREEEARPQAWLYGGDMVDVF